MFYGKRQKIFTFCMAFPAIIQNCVHLYKDLFTLPKDYRIINVL